MPNRPPVEPDTMKAARIGLLIITILGLSAIMVGLIIPPAHAQTTHDQLDLSRVLGAGTGTRNGSDDPYGNPHDPAAGRCDANCRAILNEWERRYHGLGHDPEVDRIREKWRQERREAERERDQRYER